MFENLKNTPETGASDDAKNRTGCLVFYKERGADKQDASNEEYPPASGAEVILGFDDNRMKDSDGEEGHDGNNKSYKIH